MLLTIILRNTKLTNTKLTNTKLTNTKLTNTKLTNHSQITSSDERGSKNKNTKCTDQRQENIEYHYSCVFIRHAQSNIRDRIETKSKQNKLESNKRNTNRNSKSCDPLRSDPREEVSKRERAIELPARRGTSASRARYTPGP